VNKLVLLKFCFPDGFNKAPQRQGKLQFFNFSQMELTEIILELLNEAMKERNIWLAPPVML
jgi:hypothetical protein